MFKCIPSSISLTSFFSTDDIRVVHGRQSQEDALRALLRALAINHGVMDENEYLKEILARQEAGSTLIQPGIALPHARLPQIKRPYLAVGLFPDGVELEENEEPVFLIFLVLVPLRQPAIYLQILRAVNQILLTCDDPREAFLQHRSPMEIMRFLEQGGDLAPFVSANDIMCTQIESLRENDSLRTAIDFFTSRQRDEVAVVNGDGELIGVVSTGSLMKICLPDYLLWSRDLSSMENFEPFSAVLQNEQQTWLRDILTENYVAVQADAPAIQAAVEMTRNRKTRCYVLHGRQLVGEIPLTRFLDKVFRA